MTVMPYPPTTTPSDAVTLLEQRQAFGMQLRSLREEQHVTVDALAQTTRISVAFIEALEAGDLNKLPGQVFVKGFVRSIAKALDRSDANLLASLDAVLNPVKPLSVLKVEIKNKPVRQRSDRLAKFLHNGQSLLRRGVLVQVALPALAVLVAIYWLVTSAALHRIATHLRDHTNSLGVTPAKALQLKEVAATSSEPPKPLESRGKDEGGASSSPAGHLADPGTVVAPPTAESVLPSPSSAAGKAADGPMSEATVSEPEPEKKAAVKAVATEAISSDPEAAAAQVLELTVSSAVKVRLDVDKGKSLVKELEPDTYRFTFAQKADVMIYDAAAVKIAFNGKQLGPLGAKGRIRRLSFQAPAPSTKKL